MGSLLLLFLCANVARAQTPVTGTSGATFTASADHNALAADGVTPILTRYELRFTPNVPASCAAVAPVNMGKPTPNGSNVISVVPIVTLGTLPANCVYTAVEVAIGPGGEGASVPSDPFVRVVPKIPTAGGKPAIVP